MAESNFDTIALSVCFPCLYVLANGEYDDGEDTAERIGKAMAKLWPGEVYDISPGGLCRHTGMGILAEDCECDNLGFCTSRCETCGDTHHGERYAATLLRRMTRNPMTGERISCIELERILKEMGRYA